MVVGLAPARLADDAADLLLADSELDSQLSLRNATFGVPATDFFDLFLGQLDHAMTCSPVVGEHVAVASFSDGVSHVVAAGADEPVGGILARRVVAGMADLVTRRNRSDEADVAPLGGDHPPARSLTGSDVEDAVASLRPGSPPGPAFVGALDIDFGPVGGEPLLGVVGSTHNRGTIASGLEAMDPRRTMPCG